MHYLQQSVDGQWKTIDQDSDLTTLAYIASGFVEAGIPESTLRIQSPDNTMNQNQTIDRATLEAAAKNAYDAYCESREWKSFDGDPLPQWHDTSATIRQSWRIGAQAARETEVVSDRPPHPYVSETKQLRQDLDALLQVLKGRPPESVKALEEPMLLPHRTSRERSLAITKIQEAIMWLGMDLKAMKEEGISNEPNPYPASYDPSNPVIERTAGGLSL